MITYFASEDYPKGLTIKVDGKTIYELKPKLDFSKPIKIHTNQWGEKKLRLVGITADGRRVVELLGVTYNMRQPYGLPEFFTPDANGYMIEFDQRIENEPS